MRRSRVRVPSPVLFVALVLGVVAPAPALAVQEERPELELRLRQADRKLRQGDTVGALMDVEAVLSRDADMWEAYFLRGQIQARMGDDLGARSSFVRAAELDPGNGPLHFLVASVALRLADFESSWQQLLAAAQAGYDPQQLQALARHLREELDDPGGLEAALSVPRLSVTLDGDQTLETLGLELRTLLLEEPAVGLVKPPVAAAYDLALRRVDTAEEGRAAIAVVLTRSHDGAVLMERELEGDAVETRLQLDDLVAAVVRQLRDPEGR